MRKAFSGKEVLMTAAAFRIQLISCLMTFLIVDLFQTVQIDESHSDFFHIPVSRCKPQYIVSLKSSVSISR